MRIVLLIWALINTAILLPITVFQVLMGFILYLIGKAVKNKKLEMHGIYLAIAADQNMNVAWLGYVDETISSRCGRAQVSGKEKWYIKYFLRPFVNWAAKRFGDGDNHCINAIEHQLHMEQRYEIWKWHK